MPEIPPIKSPPDPGYIDRDQALYQHVADMTEMPNARAFANLARLIDDGG